MNKFFYAFAALIMLLASCNSNYKKSKSGMEYKIYSGKATGYNKKAPKTFKDGDIIKFHISFSVERKGKQDTVLNESYGKMPQYVPYDTTENILLSPIEALMYGKVGDSIQFRISVDSLIANQLVMESDIFTKGGTIKGSLSILDVFHSSEQASADAQKEEKIFLEKEEARRKVAIVDEIKAVEKYLKEKNYNAVKTPNGAFVLIEKEGTGPKLDSGKVAALKYKGYTFDGKEFDGNMDGSKPLFEMIVGAGQAIPGFDEGLKGYFNKGAKGKIFIPASLGYGNQEMLGLPANSNLVFDIEVVDVKDAPSNNGMQLTPEQIQELQRQMQQQGHDHDHDHAHPH